MDSEIEYLDQIDSKLQFAFNVATNARDEAQNAMNEILSLKSDLLQRKIQIQRAQLTSSEQRSCDG